MATVKGDLSKEDIRVAVHEIVIDSIYEIALPAPRDGGEVVVTYPFHFSTPESD